MSDAEIGSITFDETETLVAPKMKVRPNAAIPITSAVILIIGAIVTGLIGITGIFSSGTSDSDVEQFQKNFNESVEENVTLEDMEQYFGDLEDSSHGKVSNYLLLVAAGLMGIGGVLLFRGEKPGIRFGASGSGLFVVSFLWGAWTSKQAATHLPKTVSLTLTAAQFVFAFCGLFCLSAAFLPLMFASGRAALTTETLMETMSFEEE